MSDRRGNVYKSYYYRLVRQELVNVENDLYGGNDRINEEANENMEHIDGINGGDVGEARENSRAGSFDSDHGINGDGVGEAREHSRAGSFDSDDEINDEDIGDAGYVRYESDSNSDDGIVDDVVDYLVGNEGDDGSSDGSDTGINAGNDAVDESFKSKLAKLVIKNKWSRDSTNQLLLLLRENGHEFLPKTRETLLHTPNVPIHPRVV